ncbi:hypothetical protein BCV72DRAFT_326280 [Rhizopus microsporus var. microsporus]|uniref:WWE domain-containing protein n=2 Tax=Rhizopus microsporus TaxID=58291 RepID=A0A2G4SU80_RHIZD|nr:uncharacterized protein RHIMIDRAFT_284610 [Rhizopus microsporus ATCC 52813]ORE11452.1 hypothetical protein BCV72DRAFT_326280 [Rhizopus microsporus var. microsporus]PHZ12333.1 hypothetical protein RHIMIDRAFT_284610 [Rhizopus microsporus ATCC 52813]
MAIQWVYANGSIWTIFDKNTQQQIEALWSKHTSGWIQSSSFRGPVFVDTTQMVLIADGYSCAIARRTT